MIGFLLNKDPKLRPSTTQLMKLIASCKVDSKLKHSHSRPKL